jgi:hypothetical protein
MDIFEAQYIIENFDPFCGEITLKQFKNARIFLAKLQQKNKRKQKNKMKGGITNERLEQIRNDGFDTASLDEINEIISSPSPFVSGRDVESAKQVRDATVPGSDEEKLKLSDTFFFKLSDIYSSETKLKSVEIIEKLISKAFEVDGRNKATLIKDQTTIEELLKNIDDVDKTPDEVDEELNECLNKLQLRSVKPFEAFRRNVGNYTELLTCKIFNGVLTKDKDPTKKSMVGYPYDIEINNDTIIECKARMQEGQMSVAIGKIEKINAILNKLIQVTDKSSGINYFCSMDDFIPSFRDRIDELKQKYDDMDKTSSWTVVEDNFSTYATPECRRRFKGYNRSEFIIRFTTTKDCSNAWILKNDDKSKAYLLSYYYDFDQSTKKLSYKMSIVDLKEYLSNAIETNIRSPRYGKLKQLYKLTPKGAEMKPTEKTLTEFYIFGLNMVEKYNKSLKDFYQVVGEEKKPLLDIVVKKKDNDKYLSELKNIWLGLKEKSKIKFIYDLFNVIDTRSFLNKFKLKKEIRKQVEIIVEGNLFFVNDFLEYFIDRYFDEDNINDVFDRFLTNLTSDKVIDEESLNTQFRSFIITEINKNIKNYYVKYIGQKGEDKYTSKQIKETKEKIDDLIETINEMLSKIEVTEENNEMMEELVKKISNEFKSLGIIINPSIIDRYYSMYFPKNKTYDVYELIDKNGSLENLNAELDKIQSILNRYKGGKKINTSVLSELKIGNSEPKIIGTASTGVKNYGDIDVNVETSIKHKDEIVDVIKNIEKKYILTEIKVMNKDKKYKSTSIDKIKNKINEDTDYIKIDFKVVKKKFEVYEAIFFLKEQKSSHIKEQIGELLKEKNYWKVLKRLFSIARHNDDKMMIDKITKFINSSIGKVGRYISLIDSIEEIEKIYDLTNDLKDFKQELNDKIESIIKKDKSYFNEKTIEKDYKKWINNKSMEFIRMINLL